MGAGVGDREGARKEHDLCRQSDKSRYPEQVGAVFPISSVAHHAGKPDGKDGGSEEDERFLWVLWFQCEKPQSWEDGEKVDDDRDRGGATEEAADEGPHDQVVRHHDDHEGEDDPHHPQGGLRIDVSVLATEEKGSAGSPAQRGQGGRDADHLGHRQLAGAEDDHHLSHWLGSSLKERFIEARLADFVVDVLNLLRVLWIKSFGIVTNLDKPDKEVEVSEGNSEWDLKYDLPKCVVTVDDLTDGFSITLPPKVCAVDVGKQATVGKLTHVDDERCEHPGESQDSPVPVIQLQES